MFERMEYTVARIDGDYAYLQSDADPDAEPKCVARALLPESIGEGTHLAYEMMQYSIIG
ncbi:MAG: chorismate--pyruvate lyase [Butyrivibrio sp.]|nr:chorismate--pyruvate lyase [Butyrivibrio sp.]